MFKGIILIIIGLVFSIFTYKNMRDERALEERGKTAVVQPLEEYTKKTKKKSGSVSYEADLRFETEAGQTITVTRTLPVDLLNRILTGQNVEVLYLPDSPRVVRFGHEGKATAGEIAFGLVFIAIGIFLFRRGLNAPVARND